MKITHKLREEDNWQRLAITLSNGDEVELTDNNDGFAVVRVNRHDWGKTSTNTITTEVDHLPKTRTDVKEHEVELYKSSADGELLYTGIEVVQFIPRQDEYVSLRIPKEQ